MAHIFECIIVGGPQHGLIYQRPAAIPQPTPLALVTDDGQLCTPAMRKQSGADCTRLLLLHPQATGAQIMTMMVA
jgi:hypothetical protein